MKTYFLFTATGPLVILTSYHSVTNPGLLSKLSSKGINKFIACEISSDMAKIRYSKHFDLVCQDLHESDDLRVLDYNGQRAFNTFSFAELGSPVYYESEQRSLAFAHS